MLLKLMCSEGSNFLKIISSFASSSFLTIIPTGVFLRLLCPTNIYAPDHPQLLRVIYSWGIVFGCALNHVTQTYLLRSSLWGFPFFPLKVILTWTQLFKSVFTRRTWSQSSYAPEAPKLPEPYARRASMLLRKTKGSSRQHKEILRKPEILRNPKETTRKLKET